MDSDAVEHVAFEVLKHSTRQNSASDKVAEGKLLRNKNVLELPGDLPVRHAGGDTLHRSTGFLKKIFNM